MVELFFSTLNGAKSGEPIQLVIDKLTKLGLQNIEISSGHPFEQNFFQTLLHYKKKGIRFLLHNFSPPDEKSTLVNLSNPDKKEREKVIDFIKKRIDLTKELGMDYYSFHGGFRMPNYSFTEDNSNPELIPYDTALSLFVSGLKEIASYAELRGINIGFENHVVVKGNEEKLITYKTEEIESVFDSINSKNLFLHLDVGHLDVTSRTVGLDKKAFIKKFADSVFAIHLHSNNSLEDQHLMINEDHWILPSLPIFTKLKYIIFETNSPLTKETAGSVIDIVRGALKKP